METEFLESTEMSHGRDRKPTIIHWKDSRMIRNHSIRQVADEIMNMSANQDLISINVIGKQSTGKTELCKTLAHLVHQMAHEYYSVEMIGRTEFINLEDTIKKLKPTNHILIFDDIAFLKAGASTKQIDQMQYILSIIRHLDEDKDVKIIIFKSFQYSKSIPPFLRQNDMTFISSVDGNEFDNICTMLGKNSSRYVTRLQKMQVQVKLGKANNAWFTYPLSIRGNKYFRYHAKHPFLPYLYYNGISCRLVVSPLRTWIDKVCPECDESRDDTKSIQEQDEFVEKYNRMYNGGTNSVGKAAVKKLLSASGIETYSKNITQAEKKLQKFMNDTGTTKEQVQEMFEIPTTKFQKRRKDIVSN